VSTLRELLDAVEELDREYDVAAGLARAASEKLEIAKQALMDAMNEQGTDIARKDGFRVTIQDKMRPKVLDWDRFYAYILETGSTQLLERRVSAKAYEELALQRGETLPGTDIFEYQSLRVQRG
jgi:hypothetical protein